MKLRSLKSRNYKIALNSVTVLIRQLRTQGLQISAGCGISGALRTREKTLGTRLKGTFTVYTLREFPELKRAIAVPKYTFTEIHNEF